MRVVRRRLRGFIAQLTPAGGLRGAAVLGALALACTAPVLAANSTPPPRVNVIQLQPKSIAPKRPLHVEYTFEINRLGQVTRVRTVKPSHDEPFDAHTYGNVLQMFVRTADGKAIPGLYRIAFDYDPKTLVVRRGEPVLLRAGGVNANAKGAAEQMIEIARRNANRTPPPAYHVTPGPVPTVNIKRMPDLPQVMHSATPAPHT